MAKANANKYCRMSDLSNEASVESFFVSRLLKSLGYTDNEIRLKESIDELTIGQGSKKETHRPDYVLVVGLPRWLIEVKAVGEDVDKFTYQGSAYALAINKKHKLRPLKHYMVTNGLLTRVYLWDQEEPVLSLHFDDFVDGNAKFEAVKVLLCAETLRQQPLVPAESSPGHLLSRLTLDVVKRAFLKCHRLIWKTEKVGPQAAFVSFAKLMFVKLWEDRRLRDVPAYLAKIANDEPLPAQAVRFSKAWIEEQEANEPNPVDTILFRQLAEQLEEDIARRKRKRIFEPNEKLGMTPGTIKRVVEILQHSYLFGIDEDLNGRMFETFLAATMRGRDLGQFFTPRSIVKLIARLAQPKATRGHVERVLDGCCGTGGFLIEVLAGMRSQVARNISLSTRERERLLDEVANEAIFGIDASKDPPLARIARINMYLHGDGGSRVYAADTLRNPPEASPADPLETRQNVEELKELLVKGLRFNVVVTNPPFSMDYSMEDPDEKAVIEHYELRTHAGHEVSSLRSSVLFLERYWHLLEPGGRLLTVIDDSVLSGENYAFVRNFLRDKFIVRAVVSLHGDAFRSADARVKTSILYLTRKQDEEKQPAAFVYESRYIGLDDVVMKTPPSVADQARSLAVDEIEEIVEYFAAYQRGDIGPWLVQSDRLQDRLDAKYLRPWSVSELEYVWKRAGVNTTTLDSLVVAINIKNDEFALDDDTPYTFLRISYEGRAELGEKRLGREVTYKMVMRTRADDIVVSNINAVNRAICVIPPGLEGLLMSNEFTVLRLKEGVEADPMYLWCVLRSAAVRAEFLSGSSGQGRHRVRWSTLRHQKIPLLPHQQQRAIGNHYRDILDHEKAIALAQKNAQDAIAFLELDGEAARDRLARAKPPK